MNTKTWVKVISLQENVL